MEGMPNHSAPHVTHSLDIAYSYHNAYGAQMPSAGVDRYFGSAEDPFRHGRCPQPFDWPPTKRSRMPLTSPPIARHAHAPHYRQASPSNSSFSSIPSLNYSPKLSSGNDHLATMVFGSVPDTFDEGFPKHFLSTILHSGSWGPDMTLYQTRRSLSVTSPTQTPQ